MQRITEWGKKLGLETQRPWWVENVIAVYALNYNTQSSNSVRMLHNGSTKLKYVYEEQGYYFGRKKTF